MLPVHHRTFTSGWPADRLIMQSSLSGGRFCSDSGTFNYTGNEKVQPLLSLRGGRECGGWGEIDGPDVSSSAPRTEFTHLGPALPGCQGLPKVWRKGKKRALWPAETVSASPFR